jgi:hypothetical protein
MQMADRLRELGDIALAGLADTVADRLSRLCYDATSQTQPINIDEIEEE